MPTHGPSSQGVVTIRHLLSDTFVYGAAGVANRAIGLLLLPITTALLDPADYGVLGLFGAAASILWLVVSLGVPSAFFRFYAATERPARRGQLIGSSLVLSLILAAASLAATGVFGRQLSERLFGVSALWPSGLLVSNAICTMLISLGAGRLQADGYAYRYLAVNLISVVGSRGIGLALLFLGFGPWGWIVGELVGLALSLPVLVVLAWPRLRVSVDLRTMAQTLKYGALLTPAFISQWVMVGCDKLVMKATLADPEQAIGFYSVGERISSIVVFGNVAFALAWRRFAFHNMGVPGGASLLARGMKLYLLANALFALALALLGDDLTHWLIRAVFAQGMVVIVPLTVAGWLAGLADTAPVGLHRMERPAMISAVNVAAAVLNVGLNFWAIPRFGILGAAYTTLVSQLLRALAIWGASQRAYRLPFDYRGASYGLAWMAVVFLGASVLGTRCIHALPSTWGWLASTVGQSLAVLVALAGLWKLPVFDADERAALQRWLDWACRRAGSTDNAGQRRSPGG